MKRMLARTLIGCVLLWSCVGHAAEIPSDGQPATTSVSATAVSGTGVTLTIPAGPAGLFNYLTYLEVVQVATLTAVGVTTVVCTTTGITGTPSITLGSNYVIGAIAGRADYTFSPALKGSAAATAITVVCPATTNVIWRINGFYFVAP